MSSFTRGSAVPPCTARLYASSRLVPVANGTNAAGMVGVTRLPSASDRAPPPARPVRFGLPSLKMITPAAPAACAFCTLTPKLHVPRWISAIRPGTKPVKSAAVQPLAELGVGVGGMMMPPTGWTSAVTVPMLSNAFHSAPRAKSCAVGEISLNVGVPANA